MKKRTLLKAGAAPVVLGIALLSAPAMAQDDVTAQGAITEDDEIDDGAMVVVTGSRIARKETETAAPIAVVGAEEFKLSGTVNVENVINQLPQVVPGTTSFSNNPGNGQATLNLRGLGAARTLVLVNNRRWMVSDTAQIVDLNTIPQFLIEAVDVVTGGAGAVYGSDALSGVVNFRLRQIEGLEVGGQYNLTGRGDAARYQFYGALGASFDDGRGNATVFAEYFNREDLFQGQRAFSNFALGGETFGLPQLQFGSSSVLEGRINTPGTIATSNAVDLNGDGDFTDPGEAAVLAPLAQGLAIDDGIFEVPGTARPRAGDTYNYAPENFLQIPQERYLLGGYADYEFIDGHTAYTEVAFTNNRVATELAPTPITGTVSLDIATVSQFLSPETIAELNTLDANEAAASAARVANGLSALPTAELGVVSTFFQRRLQEVGARNNLDERNAFRILAGVRGEVTDTINYDGYYLYSRTRNSNTQDGNVSRSAFNAGLDGTGPVAINPFGAGTLTQEAVDTFSIATQNGDISTQEIFNFAVNGTFNDFAIGDSTPIGFVAGFEYREVASEFLPDTALSSGDVVGFNAGEPTAGGYNVTDFFGELNVPIEFGDARLELNGAVRYSDYSLEAVGGVFTYAGGVQFSPIPDITFRGQYQRAVRAPNVGELFAGQAIGFPGATDPCAVAGNQNDAVINGLCIAQGVPAGNVGNPAIQLNAQIPALIGGNPNLQEETSDSITFGVVLQPSFVPGLTVTVDYFDIQIEDAIAPIGLQTQFDLCFNTFQDINNPFCQAFVGIRAIGGEINVDNPPVTGIANVADISTSGIDLNINYNTSLPFSLLTDTGEQRLDIAFLGTWLNSDRFQPVATEDTVFNCEGRFGQNCGEPRPTFKWTSRVSFIDGPLTSSIRWRHLSGTDDNDPNVLFTDFNGRERLGAYDLIDLTFSVDATDNLTLAFGVNNIFDTLPAAPQFDANGNVINSPNALLLGDNQEQANTFPSTFDVLGRDFFISANFRF